MTCLASGRASLLDAALFCVCCWLQSSCCACKAEVAEHAEWNGAARACFPGCCGSENATSGCNALVCGAVHECRRVCHAPLDMLRVCGRMWRFRRTRSDKSWQAEQHLHKMHATTDPRGAPVQFVRFTRAGPCSQPVRIHIDTCCSQRYVVHCGH
jgi:hypothetical protein